MKYKTNRIAKDGRKFVIEIRLSRKSSKPYFSITGSIYKKGKHKTKRYLETSGAIGHYIAQEFPEYQIFEDLHLSNYKGEPMYSIDNGLYHIENSKPSVVKEYLRLHDDELAEVLKASSKLHLSKILFDLGVPERWLNEARGGITLLEELTGETFEKKADL